MSHYYEAKKQWEERPQQIRLATGQFSDQVLKAGDQAWRLFVPDEEYWNVICPVCHGSGMRCGCPTHIEDGGFCWSETAEVITDVVLRTVATVQEIEGSGVDGTSMNLGLFSRQMTSTCLRQAENRTGYQIVRHSEVKPHQCISEIAQPRKVQQEFRERESVNQGETVRFPMYSAVIWGNFMDNMKRVSTKDSEPIVVEDAGMFAQTLRHNQRSQELRTAVQAVHVSTNRVSGRYRLLNDKGEIVNAGKGMAKFRTHSEIQLQMDTRGEAKVISWVPIGCQLFTYYGSSNEGDTDNRGWTHRDAQLKEFKEGARHDKDMVKKRGKSQEDLLQYVPNNALRRQYAQGAGADMLANMQMEMGMAMEASTGCNKGIEADIREVQEYIGLVQERETQLFKVLSRDDISTVVQAAKDKGSVMYRIIEVCMGVEAKRQRQGQEDYDPTSIADLMRSEMQKGKKLALVEKKPAGQPAGARPEDAAREKRKPVEGKIFGRVEQKTQGVTNTSGKKELKANIVLTPVQLRNKHGYPQCTLDNMNGSHSLSVINAEWLGQQTRFHMTPISSQLLGWLAHMAIKGCSL